MENKNTTQLKPPVKPPRGPMIRFVFVLVTSVAISMWITFAPLWPATIFIKWQLRWFDGYYYPKYTFVVVWVIMLVAFTFVTLVGTWLWGKIIGKREDKGNRE